jgi:hypothetical protein
MITTDSASTEDNVTLHISNGDLKAFKEIIKKWQFKDYESVLKYTLAVLSQAEGNSVFIEDGSGTKIGLQPTAALKKETPNGSDETSHQ